MDLIAELESLKISHYTWYSCPLLNDEYPKDQCNCGAEAHNNKVDGIINYIKTRTTV